jgi:ADP-ribose pyrophosphatase
VKGRPGARKFEVHDRGLVHRSRKYRCVKASVRFEDGRTADREVVRHSGAAVILPELPDGRLVLEEVFRHAAGGWLLEVPAGTLELGEAPEVCAARELEEETGYRAAALRFLGSWYPSPGILDETMHLYHATGLVKTATHLDEDEFLEVRVVTKAEAAAMVRDGRIVDGKTLLALFLGGVVAAAPGGGPA